MTLLLAPIATGGKAKPAITINLIILHLPKLSNHSDLSKQGEGPAPSKTSMPPAPGSLRRIPDTVPGAATRVPRDAPDTGRQKNPKGTRRKSRAACERQSYIPLFR